MSEPGPLPAAADVEEAAGPSGRYPEFRRATALAGTAAVTLVLAFSRWGTTIGVGPLYLTDGLIALAVVHGALTAWRTRGARPMSLARFAPLPPVFVAFFIYLVVRFLLAIENGPLLLWLRDAVPYLYGGLVIMSATAYLHASARSKARTARIFVVALFVHLCWTAVMQLTPLGLQQVTVPFVGAPIFQPRPDIEAALNSVFAAICLRAVILRRYRLFALIGLGGAATVILFQGTRAGTIALIVSLVASFALTFAGLGRLDGRRVGLLLAAPAILVAAVILLPLTQPGQRIIATVFPDQVEQKSAAQQNAEGTAHARALVWSGVIGWTESSTPRLIFGSGFGNDFLTESGTVQYLEGTLATNVRSPHDWFIGTFARMGLVGLLLQVGMVLSGLIIIFRARREIANEALAFISAMLVLAIIPVASLGVVLEAPFGAVPWFWGLGVVYTFRTRSRVADALGRPTGASGERMELPSGASDVPPLADPELPRRGGELRRIRGRHADV